MTWLEITLLTALALAGTLNTFGWFAASKWRARSRHNQARADKWEGRFYQAIERSDYWFLKWRDSEQRRASGREVAKSGALGADEWPDLIERK